MANSAINLNLDSLKRLFVVLNLLASCQLFSQDCLPAPNIVGPVCTICAPPGWNFLNSPDVMNTDGSHPIPGCDVNDISGPSPNGGTVVFLASGGASEAITTTVTGLNTGQEYAFGVWWEMISMNNCAVLVGGNLEIIVDGQSQIFTGAENWELVEFCFMPTSSSVDITVQVQNVFGTSIAVDFTNCSELTACCQLEATAPLDQFNVCPGDDANIIINTMNSSGPIIVNWTSVPAIGTSYLSDVNSLTPTFNYPTGGSFPGDVFTFTATVQDNDCLREIEVVVNVEPAIIPTFDFSICKISTEFDFPTVSMNGYSGSWSGNFDLINLGGTIQNYIFTLDVGQANCLTEWTFPIEIEIPPIPIFLDIPNDITVFCDQLPVPAVSLLYTNGLNNSCNISGVVDPILTGSSDNCGGTLQNLWLLIDECDRTILHTQNIFVLPAAPPFFIDPPKDLVLDCNEYFPNPDILIYTNLAFGDCEILGFSSPVVSMIDVNSQIVEWEFINPCNNEIVQHTQSITRLASADFGIDPDSIDLCLGDFYELDSILIIDPNAVNPAVSYHDSSPANSSNELSNFLVEPVADSIFYILITDQNSGCSAEFPFVVSVQLPENVGSDSSLNVCFNDPNNINLFDLLAGTPDTGGVWTNLSTASIDLSDPENISLAGLNSDIYQFGYSILGVNNCPSDTAIVSLILFPEIVMDVLTVECSVDLTSYEIVLNSNGYVVNSSHGLISTSGTNVVTISGIPIGVSVDITASNLANNCNNSITIDPPTCSCDVVDPPVSDGDVDICFGEMNPELSVSLGVNQVANWFDSPTGGTLLLAASNSFFSSETAVGIYQYYVESVDTSNGCSSLVRTEIIFEIQPLLSISVDVDDEICAGNEDGQVVINSTDADEYSLDGITYVPSNVFANLAPGGYTAFVNGSTGCVDSLDFIINDGQQLSFSDLSLICNDNGTENDSSDDFYEIQFIVENNLMSTNLFEIYSEGVLIQTGEYNQLILLTIPALGQTVNFEIQDQISECTLTIPIGQLLPCSSNCSISISNISLICEDNSTITDPTDDFYTVNIVYNFSEPGPSNQFEILVNGIPQEIVNYGNLAEITLPANGASPTISIQDIDIPICTDDQIIGPLDDCAQACILNAVVGSVLCDANGTPNDPSDDTFTFEVVVDGQNVGSTWSSDLAVNGNNGTPVLFGPFPISAGSQIVNITDVITLNCSTTLNVDPPIACSSSCDIAIEYVDAICNDNGTVTDPSDDFYIVEVYVDPVGVGPSGQYELFADAVSQGVFNYGPFALINLPANGGSPNVSVQDVDILVCTDAQVIGPLNNCAQACNISAIAGSILCNNNGTVNDPSDDTFTFELEVNGQNTGATWTSDLAVNGGYGIPILFGPFPIGAGPQLVNITDNVTPNCTTSVSVDPPVNCSSNCTISIENILSTCDDDGTITNPSDDFYDIEILTSVSGSGSSGQFEVFADGISQGIFNYGGIANITLPANGLSPLISVQDVDISACSYEQAIGPLDNCAQACSMVATFTNIQCDDNGTGNDSSDDTYTFDLTVNGQNVGSTWTSDQLVNGSYGVAYMFGPYLISNGAQLINISDIVTSNCTTAITVASPNSCSNCIQIVDAGIGGELSCSLTSVTLSASSSTVGSYEWTGPNFALSNSLVATVTEDGWYYFSATFPDGCISMDSVEVTQNSEIPIASGGVDTALNCLVTEVLLEGSLEANQSGQWFDINGDTISTSSVLLVNSVGNYYYQVIDDNNGCGSNLDEVVVSDGAIYPAALIIADPSDLLNCLFSTITLTAIPQDNVVYSWDIVSEIVELPQVDITEPGTYTLFALDTLSGCTEMDQIIIDDFEEYPLINIQAVDPITCYDSTIVIDASNSQNGPTITYTWYDQTFTEIPGGTGTDLSVTVGGIYYLQLENSENGCTNIDTVVVENLQNIPLSTAGEDIDLPCLETQANLNLITSGSSNGLNINWTSEDGVILSGSDSESPLVDGIGNYIVEVQDIESGCIIIDSMFVSNNPDVPQAALLNIANESCLYFENGTLQISEIDGGEAPYSFTLNGNTTNESGYFQDLQEGTYELNITDINGCQVDTSFTVLPGIELELDLPALIELIDSENGIIEGITNIDPNELQLIQWSPSELVACENCLETEVYGESGQDYTLYIVHENGCSAIASIRVLLRSTAGIYIPNAFSPNNDGFNDAFTLFANDAVAQVDEMLIFDRWGELVFKNNDFLPNDLNFGWDGKMNGQELNPAVFVYTFKVQLTDGTVRQISGDITLTR